MGVFWREDVLVRVCCRVSAENKISVWRCVAVCCGTLLCVAVCGSVFFGAKAYLNAFYCRVSTGGKKTSVLLCVELQYVAEWCIVLQCVAVCFSVLQCLSVCCSVLQCA